jgi:hypothetical protein
MHLSLQEQKRLGNGTGTGIVKKILWTTNNDAIQYRYHILIKNSKV